MSVVYVIRNEAMPGLVKIGRTDADAEKRMASLYNTSVPFPFECVKAVSVPSAEEAKTLEAALHVAFADHRCNLNREFFRIGEEQPLAILNAWPTGVDATPVTQREIDGDVTEADASALDAARKRRERTLKRHVPVKNIDGEPTEHTLCGYGPDDDVFMADEDNPVSCAMCLHSLERETRLERP